MIKNEEGIMEEKKVLLLNLEDVLPNRFQPRIRFNETAINELAESIKKYGVIQPIVVRQIGDKYEIIAGERRFKASTLAGKATIPAIVANLDDRNSAEIALIENVQRQDLTPIEEAVSYKKILDMGYLTQTELAEKLGKEQSTIANKLRLLNLTEIVQEALLEEKISERHARSLLRLDEKRQKEMLDRILNERMTVRKTDEEIDNMLGKGKHVEILDFSDNDEIKVVSPIEETPTPQIILQPKAEEKEEVVVNPIVEEKPNLSQPGFMDIEKIETDAKDIYVEAPKVDMDTLLKSNIEEVKTEPEEEIIQGKFFSFVKEKEIKKEEPKIEVPFIKPIIEEKQESTFNFDIDEFDKNFQTSQNAVPVEEIKEEVIVPQIGIKNVINEIRKCSSTIEKMGFEVDVEEIDFENMYQVIFKVEKK